MHQRDVPELGELASFMRVMVTCLCSQTLNCYASGPQSCCAPNVCYPIFTAGQARCFKPDACITNVRSVLAHSCRSARVLLRRLRLIKTATPRARSPAARASPAARSCRMARPSPAAVRLCCQFLQHLHTLSLSVWLLQWLMARWLSRRRSAPRPR